MESHFTATGLVLNKSHDKALMIFHKKLSLWLPAGGHVEKDELPHDAVVREVFEETGVKAKIIDISKDLKLSKQSEIQIPAPCWVLHEYIPEHKGIAAHMHYDFIYRLDADCEDCIHDEREVATAQWFTRQQLADCDTSEATRTMYFTFLK